MRHPCRGRKTWGHSLIVNSWGEILADGGEDVGIVTSTIDLDQVAEARRKIPALNTTAPSGTGRPVVQSKRVVALRRRYTLTVIPRLGRGMTEFNTSPTNKNGQGNVQNSNSTAAPRTAAGACYWLAKELGLEIEAVEIDLNAGEQQVAGLPEAQS